MRDHATAFPTLDSQDDLDAALAPLRAACPLMDRAIDLAEERTGPVRLRRRAGGFAGLLDIILGQQVSVASAAAVRDRLDAAGLADPAALAAAPDAALRACGMSRQKIRYARALATEGPDYAALAALHDDALIEALLALPGIGRWSAEIYAMFSLGRVDVFAAGDLALQEAARHLTDAAARPGEADLRAFAARWAPRRTVAATVLWQYYAAVKSREGVL